MMQSISLLIRNEACKIASWILILLAVLTLSNNVKGQLESYGSVLHGDHINDLYGYATALNAAGDIMAVGAPKNSSGAANSGQVRVYQFSGNDWVQMGSDILGNSGGQQCGSSIDLNFEGNRIAIGCPYSDGGSQNVFAGSVKVYEWDGTSWNQLGTDIYGLTIVEESGSSLSLDSEGNTVVIASPCYGNQAVCSGGVRVYELSNGDWVQKGNLLEGIVIGDRVRFGDNLEISGDGNTLVISANHNNYPYDTVPAFAMVFRWDDVAWNQYGETFVSDHPNRWSNMKVCVSENGSTVAISDCWSSSPPAQPQIPRGVVRVFDLFDNELIQKGEEINNYNNGYEGIQLQMTLDGNTLFVGADDFNSQWNGYNYHFVNWNGEFWVSEEYDPEWGADFFDRSQKMNGYASAIVTGEHIFGRWPYEWHGAIKAFSTPTLSTSSPEETILNEFKLFPNPAQERLTVSNTVNSSFQNGQILIYEASGRLVHTASLRGSETTLDISGIENGIYMVKILTENKRVEVSKVIIQN